jgi:uncharacterized protein (TIGR03067 family)
MSRKFVAAVLPLAALVGLSSGRAVSRPPEGVSLRTVLSDDVEMFQGDWRVVSDEMHGLHNEDLKELLIVVKKNIITMKKGTEVVWKATLRLNPSKMPKAIDLSILECQDLREGVESIGIYKFEKNTLKLCVSDWDKGERPKKFESKDGCSDEVFVLQKEKQ